MILNEIRKARELYSGVELAAELSRIQQRLDNVECLSVDIVINLLLTYRDIQVTLLLHDCLYRGGSQGAGGPDPPPSPQAALHLLNDSLGQQAARSRLNYSAGLGYGSHAAQQRDEGAAPALIKSFSQSEDSRKSL